MRVELAKEHYLDRLKREREAPKAEPEPQRKFVFSEAIMSRHTELITDKNCKVHKVLIAKLMALICSNGERSIMVARCD